MSPAQGAVHVFGFKLGENEFSQAVDEGSRYKEGEENCLVARFDLMVMVWF